MPSFSRLLLEMAAFNSSAAFQTGIPMSDIADVLKKYGGPVLLGFGVLGVVALLMVVFRQLTKMAPAGESLLPLLAIGGVVVLILLLTAVAMIFSVLNLTIKIRPWACRKGRSAR
jgi:hypothetical protein